MRGRRMPKRAAIFRRMVLVRTNALNQERRKQGRREQRPTSVKRNKDWGRIRGRGYKAGDDDPDVGVEGPKDDRRGKAGDSGTYRERSAWNWGQVSRLYVKASLGAEDVKGRRDVEGGDWIKGKKRHRPVCGSGMAVVIRIMKRAKRKTGHEVQTATQRG